MPASRSVVARDVTQLECPFRTPLRMRPSDMVGGGRKRGGLPAHTQHRTVKHTPKHPCFCTWHGSKTHSKAKRSRQRALRPLSVPLSSPNFAEILPQARGYGRNVRVSGEREKIGGVWRPEWAREGAAADAGTARVAGGGTGPAADAAGVPAQIQTYSRVRAGKRSSKLQ